MKDPFKGKQDRLHMARIGLPVLLDRVGGRVTITRSDLDAVAAKYGGAVAIRAEELEPGRSFRLSLAPSDAKRPPDPTHD